MHVAYGYVSYLLIVTHVIFLRTRKYFEKEEVYIFISMYL